MSADALKSIQSLDSFTERFTYTEMSKARTVVMAKPTGSTMVCGEMASIEAKFRFAACSFALLTANSLVILARKLVY